MHLTFIYAGGKKYLIEYTCSFPEALVVDSLVVSLEQSRCYCCLNELTPAVLVCRLQSYYFCLHVREGYRNPGHPDLPLRFQHYRRRYWNLLRQEIKTYFYFSVQWFLIRYDHEKRACPINHKTIIVGMLPYIYKTFTSIIHWLFVIMSSIFYFN